MVRERRLTVAAVYTDLLLWTLFWYAECMQKVQPDVGNLKARLHWCDGASKDLDRLHRKHSRKR
jgi:hypothetical protein